MITTVLAAADPGTMINNALSLLRNVGVPLIILAGSAHLISKVVSKQFTINALARTAVICCFAVAVFLLLPVFAESFTNVTEQVTGGGTGVR
ncbi:hypothetical protein EB73_34755 [Mycobacterium sp. SWH-M3]|nr:hypothetical protein EB73_34755 [Mycobacterium sp. SWH-M3]